MRRSNKSCLDDSLDHKLASSRVGKDEEGKGSLTTVYKDPRSESRDGCVIFLLPRGVCTKGRQ